MPEDGSTKGERFNPFRWIASIGAARPWLVLAVAAVVSAAAGALTYGMRISTSRYALVSAERNQQQARLFRFFERFGIQDAMVLVLSGSTPAEQQRVQREVCAKLEREPEFAGRMLCRIGPRELAEVAMLWEPGAMAKQLERGGGEVDVAKLIEGGLPQWIASIDKGIAAGLENGKADPKEAQQGSEMLVKLLRALDAQLSGGDALDTLGVMASARDAPSGQRMDEQGFLIGPGKSYHLVALFPALPGSEGYELSPLVEKVRKAYREVKLGEVKATLTGMPAVAVDELAAVDRGFHQSTIGTTVGIILLLLIGYRSLRYSVMALVPLGVGTVLTMAVARVVFHGLNVITSAFVSVLMGIGINFAIFALSRYSEDLRGGASQEEAVRSSLSQTGLGIIISAGTTVLAFLTITTTQFTAYQELGWLVGAGLVIMVLVTLLLVPAMAMVLNRKGTRHAASEFVGMHLLEPIVRRGKWPVLAIAAVVAAFGSYAYKLRFNARYFDFLPVNAESVRGLAIIEEDKGSSPVLANMTSAGVEEARAMADKLRQLHAIAGVETASDLLPPLTPERLADLRAALKALGRKPDFAKLRGRARSAKEVAQKIESLHDALDEAGFALRQAGWATESVDGAKAACGALQKTLLALPDDGKVALGELEVTVADLLERAWTTADNVAARGRYEPGDLPSPFRARFASKDGKALALYALPAGNIWDDVQAAEFTREVRSVDPEANGLALEVDTYQRDIKQSFTMAGFLTAGLALISCVLGFRSLRDSLLSMLPVAIGLAAMMAFMAAADIRVNVANIVAFPLSLGMGVEAGAHIMNRCRQSELVRGVAELSDIIEGTGSAVMIASTTTIMGFGALMIADYRAMKSLGVIMCVGMTSNLLAALVFLPALLVAVKRAR